jgi:transposase
MLGRLIGKDAGLLLDIAAYTIISEDNAAQYYPDYAYNHALFTEDMRIFSDSKVSDFLRDVTVNQPVRFLNEWNEKRDHREKIYISYDATNKNCEAGDIELVETGHPKDAQGLPVFNYSVAYDRNNREPLFYEGYPGSIVDISQLKYMLGKAKSYGYQHIGFILDRGYFSKENIQFMDANGFEFVIMVKGMRKLVNELVLREKGSFEESRANSIRTYKVSGTTVKHSLYADDSQDRYFHIYFSEKKQASEREELESKIDRMARKMKEWEGQPVRLGGDFARYFDLIYYHEGKPDEKFMMGIEKTDVIDQEIRLCGYFAIITSEEMTAAEALTLYKSRDTSEKLFRGDKSYLGNRSFRNYFRESVEAKIFVEFIALIIRNKMSTCLKDENERLKSRQNYMNVPASIRELEKIELIRLLDGEYRLDHAVTARQKTILKAFGMDANYIKSSKRTLLETLNELEV